MPDIISDDSIESYIRLYNEGTPIKNIKPLNNENYKVFSLANTDIRIIDRDKVYDKLIRLEKIKYFLNDHIVFDRYTGKSKSVEGNRYFYMIPVQTVEGTIVDFIFRRVFDIKKSDHFDFKKNRYHSVKPYKSNIIKKIPFMYGFYKDFKNFDSDSINGAKPIVICEGCKDCIYLKQFYPYVLAINTSTIGFNGHILRNITDKIVVVSDSDEAGSEAYFKDRYSLRKLDFKIGKVKLDEGIKDPASYIKHKDMEVNLKRRLFKVIRDLEVF